jgi:hypothetical protein
MNKIVSVVLFWAFALLSVPAQTIGGGVSIGSGVTIGGMYPILVPAGATAHTSLEQTSGWTGDSTFSVSGAYAPAVCSITPTGLGNPCPGAGTSTGGTYSGGGGGTTLVLGTDGIAGKYTGWMAKKTIGVACGQTHMLLDASVTFDVVTPIQAFELGRRLTNCAQITDNGQVQFVPIGGGQLRLDHVPSSSGGWEDTGCRFPMFVANTPYSVEIYYSNDANGALSIVYVMLNGSLCMIPPSMQHIAGIVQAPAWGANEAVMAFQPDDNTTGGTYNATVTISAWTWQ